MLGCGVRYVDGNRLDRLQGLPIKLGSGQQEGRGW